MTATTQADGLRELREAAGLSGSEMARRLGIDRSTVWFYEHGRALDRETFDRWLALCGADPATTMAMVKLRAAVLTEPMHPDDIEAVLTFGGSR